MTIYREIYSHTGQYTVLVKSLRVPQRSRRRYALKVQRNTCFLLYLTFANDIMARNMGQSAGWSAGGYNREIVQCRHKVTLSIATSPTLPSSPAV